jgi:muramidase (phage lysozyme)
VVVAVGSGGGGGMGGGGLGGAPFHGHGGQRAILSGGAKEYAKVARESAAANLGGGGVPTGNTAVAKELPKEARGLLDALSGPESRGSYSMLIGGKHFSDYSQHPPGNVDAGRYQDIGSTWRRIQQGTGLKDFSPHSQDLGNWWLAQQDYKASTHRDLLGDLKSGHFDPRGLQNTWVSIRNLGVENWTRRYYNPNMRRAIAEGTGGGPGSAGHPHHDYSKIMPHDRLGLGEASKVAADGARAQSNAGTGVSAGTYAGRPYTHAEPGGPQSAAGYRAQGGPVSRGQPYVVGEHGPEMFVPAKSGHIHKLPKAVQDAIAPYRGLMKGMPKGDYITGGRTLPWDVPSDRLDIIPDDTAEQIKYGWLKARKMIGHAWTQKKLEDMESKRFQQHFWKPGPGTNPPPQLQNINFNERLRSINLRQANQTVTGSASLKIALENFPRGTRTTSKLAGMFKDIDVDRGHSAPWAAG